MAEGIMKKYIDEAALTHKIHIDSAGTHNYHEGELPDARMRQHAFQRGYELTHHSRPVKTDDFDNFDLILAMDDSNLRDLMRKAPTVEAQKKIKRITDYCSIHTLDHVPDPYYGGAEGFNWLSILLEDACKGLLKGYKIIFSQRRKGKEYTQRAQR
jgi:protein-tyrosine phosphatase